MFWLKLKVEITKLPSECFHILFFFWIFRLIFQLNRKIVILRDNQFYKMNTTQKIFSKLKKL